MTSYKRFIHKRILDRVQRILLTPTSDRSQSNLNNNQQAVKLSLQILASFEFLGDKPLALFDFPPPFDVICREVASDRMLHHKSPQIRRSAVAAILWMLRPMIPPTSVTLHETEVSMTSPISS